MPDYESFGSAPVGDDYAVPHVIYEAFPPAAFEVAAPVEAPAVVQVRGARAPERATDELGIDIDVMDDLPPTFRLAYGPKVLANYIARELITPEGFLALNFEGDPGYGLDIRGRLNGAWSVRELSSLAAALEGKIKRHERVSGAKVDVSHSLATSTLTVHIEVQTAAGPFKFVLAVTDVSVALLHPE
jgi:hypothetical protein